MTTRRSFLLGLTAAFAAPAVVRADSLMKLWVPPLPIVWGDGVHDDAPGLNALLAGERAAIKSGCVGVRGPATVVALGANLLIASTITLHKGSSLFVDMSRILTDGFAPGQNILHTFPGSKVWVGNTVIEPKGWSAA